MNTSSYTTKNIEEEFTFPFEELDVRKVAMELTKKIYLITKKMPEFEKYGLIDQLRRAAVSIVLNIAEGKGRYYDKEFLRFLYIARGSLYVCVTLLKLAEQLEYISCRELGSLLKGTFEIQRKNLQV